jgi:hypothetical protein
MKEFLQCNQQQQGATMYVNPASVAQLNSWTKYIYTYPKKRRITRKNREQTCFLSLPTAASPMKRVVWVTPVLR